MSKRRDQDKWYHPYDGPYGVKRRAAILEYLIEGRLQYNPRSDKHDTDIKKLLKQKKIKLMRVAWTGKMTNHTYLVLAT